MSLNPLFTIILIEYFQPLVFTPIFIRVNMRRIHSISSCERIKPPTLIERLIVCCYPFDITKEVPKQRAAATKSPCNDYDVASYRGPFPMIIGPQVVIRKRRFNRILERDVWLPSKLAFQHIGPHRPG